MEPSGNLNERLFLYEVVMPSNNEDVRSPSHYRQSQFTLKVPYRRMKQELQRITRLGGKILNITPYDSSLMVNLPWWIEIETSQPNCLYYFGPFDAIDEARSYESGYLEDLRLEGAQGISGT
ncbi:hypothetical protein C7H19_12180 [Aphanothece hegewaldii CCALA 016]|uniref:CpcD-like domain-containing protein n=1 Tax=Aphanothece hegewaldii CCALA 016 TaxID=2107694 RepID=A0A2T1LXU8_9CHRO|nr:hypothetical protein C7H19_12180 [Aphanothece hegewaldii CCALA 016]